MRFKIFSFVLFLMLFVSCQVTIKETVITPKSSDALLSKLEIYNGEKLLDINFSSTRYEYVYFLQEDGTNFEVSLKYEKSDSNSKVYANSDSLMLERNSSNYFNITVISEDAKVTNILCFLANNLYICTQISKKQLWKAAKRESEDTRLWSGRCVTKPLCEVVWMS